MKELLVKIKTYKNLLVLIGLVGVILLGNRLREFSYADVPLPGETADEYSFAWVGLSLIRDHYPVGWSGIAAYKKHDYQRINVDQIFDKYNRKLFPIDKPWFDHPPLFGLITGGYAYLKGAREFVDTSVILLRRPMLKIAILTTALVFLLGWKLYDKYTGLLAALLYSIVPTFVISSRLALAENGYTPLFLASLLFAVLYLDKRRKIYWYAAVVIAAVAILFKLSAVAIAISLFFLVLLFGGKEKRWMVKNLSIGIIAAGGIFVLYGLYFGWETFVAVFTTNTSRVYGAGSEVFFQALNHLRITKPFNDGWIVAGFISLSIISFLEWRKNLGGTILTIATFSYLMVFVLFGSEPYGWYRFPFFPFLTIATAKVLFELCQKPNLFVFFALILLPFGTATHRLLGVEGFQEYIPYFRYFVLFLLGLFAYSLVYKDKKSLVVQRIVIVTTIIFTVWLSVQEVFLYTIEKWYLAS